MDIKEALKYLSVNIVPLDENKKNDLDNKGFTILSGVINTQWLSKLREQFEDLCDKEGAGAEAKEPGFDPTGKQLYIDPEECIDCGACEPECPVEAIFEEDAVPEEWNSFIKINYDWFGRDYDG